MVLMEWKEEYRIGIPAVDYEHQELIALLNDLYEGLSGEIDQGVIADFLGEVYARISAHFALEERVMAERGYDQLAEHKADHELLLDDIRDIMDESEMTDPSLLAAVLGPRLENWFGDHFKTQDARLHRRLNPDDLGLGEI